MTASDRDWRKFGARSDVAYKAALAGDYSALAAHNLIRGAKDELRYCQAIAKLYNHSFPLSKCLDVGCGGGGMTAAIRRFGRGDVVGVDLSPPAVEFARQQHPDCRFVLGDATRPPSELSKQRFDFILFREFHPFTRADNLTLHLSILDQYRNLLAPGGTLVIGHARHGGGMHYPSLDFAALRMALPARGLVMHGPDYLFLHKHLRWPPHWRWQVALLSTAAHWLARATGARWITYALLWQDPK
jgi:SAM-dependent methyltransferase